MNQDITKPYTANRSSLYNLSENIDNMPKNSQIILNKIENKKRSIEKISDLKKNDISFKKNKIFL